MGVCYDFSSTTNAISIVHCSAVCGTFSICTPFFVLCRISRECHCRLLNVLVFTFRRIRLWKVIQLFRRKFMIDYKNWKMRTVKSFYSFSMALEKIFIKQLNTLEIINSGSLLSKSSLSSIYQKHILFPLVKLDVQILLLLPRISINLIW